MATKSQSRLQNFVKFLSLALLVTLAACTGKKENAGGVRELKVFTWSQYLREEVIKEFEKEQNAKVTLDYFSSNEELLAKLQATVQAGGRGYDLIFPSDYMVSNMRELGLLRELDKSKLTFLADFDKAFLNPSFDPELKHAIPFAWGTTGVAVNTKLDKDIDLKSISWKEMLENPKYKGKVTLLDDVKECLHVALLAQGKNWASAGEADIKAAFDWLKKNKKNLRLFTAQTKPVIEANECVLCQVYSGDALNVADGKPEIKYTIPREGATLWTDTMAVPKNASDVELAYAFMNKLLNAADAKSFTEKLKFATANAKAKTLLPATITGNPSIYPEAATFQRLAYLNEKPELLPLIDRLWTELKSQ